MSNETYYVGAKYPSGKIQVSTFVERDAAALCYSLVKTVGLARRFLFVSAKTGIPIETVVATIERRLAA